MAEFESPVLAGHLDQKTSRINGNQFLPYWAASNIQCAENLLECSDEPIEYDDDEEDYQDNCFFFPEDCILPVRKDSGCAFVDHPSDFLNSLISEKNNKMTPELPDIKMLDTEALSDLLEDNLSPPEITSILYDSAIAVPQTLLTVATAYFTQMERYLLTPPLSQYVSCVI